MEHEDRTWRRGSAWRGAVIRPLGFIGLLLVLTLFRVSLVTAQEPPPVRIVQLCDPQIGMGGYAHDLAALERAVEQINRLAPDRVVVCGDLVENAEEGAYRDVRRVLDELRIPVHWVPGNHDLGNRPTRRSLALYRERMGADRLVVEEGNCSLLLVNSSLWKVDLGEETEAHDRWFERELKRASSRGRTILVVAHYPPFTVRPDEGEHYFNLPPARRHKLLALLDRHHVAAFLAGHLHRVRLLQHGNLRIVCGETTSRMFDGAPLGFRLWHIESDGRVRHQRVEIDTTGLPRPGPLPREFVFVLLVLGWGIAAPVGARCLIRFRGR